MTTERPRDISLPQSSSTLEERALDLIRQGLTALSYREIQNKERRERIIELYQQGYTLKEIASELGVSRGTVDIAIAKLRKSGEVKLRRDIPKRKKEERKQKIAELYLQGYTNKDMASELGVSRGTIERVLLKLRKSNEIKPRKDIPRRMTEEREKRIKELQEKGCRAQFEKILEDFMRDHPNQYLCLSDVAETLGISRERARQLYQAIAAEKKVPPVNHHHQDRQIPENIDSEINKYLPQRLDDKAIAAILGVRSKDVKEAKRRIRRQQQEEFYEACRELRSLGYTTDQICELTGRNRGSVWHTFVNLGKIDQSIRIRKQRPTKEEIKSRDAQIQVLKERNLTYAEIAEELGIDIYAVVNSMHRLKDSTTVKSSRRTKEELTILDGEIEKLLSLGVSHTKIMNTLGIKSWSFFYRRIINLQSLGRISLPSSAAIKK